MIHTSFLKGGFGQYFTADHTQNCERENQQFSAAGQQLPPGERACLGCIRTAIHCRTLYPWRALVPTVSQVSVYCGAYP